MGLGSSYRKVWLGPEASLPKWLLVGGLRSSHRPLQRAADDTASPQSGWSKRKRAKNKCCGTLWPNMGMTCHHISHIPLATLTNPGTMWEDTSQGWETDWLPAFGTLETLQIVPTRSPFLLKLVCKFDSQPRWAGMRWNSETTVRYFHHWEREKKKSFPRNFGKLKIQIRSKTKQNNEQLVWGLLCSNKWSENLVA